MVKIFEALNHAEAHMVAGLLEAVGVEAEVRGEALMTTVDGGGAIPGMRPGVWLADPHDRVKAQEVVDQYLREEPLLLPGEAAWTCSGCQEVHEPQFGACWKCGRERAGNEGNPPSGMED